MGEKQSHSLQGGHLLYDSTYERYVALGARLRYEARLLARALRVIMEIAGF